MEDIENNYLQILSFSDINYLNILNDYRRNFHGKAVEVHTNYKPLEKFKVVFNQTDLPHLMGWGKVAMEGRKSAKRVIADIDCSQLTLESSRKHGDFNKIKKRMLHYNFLYDVFIEQSINACVMTSNMKPNRLKLDIVFYQEVSKEAVILGLRKDQHMDVFVPTTLHTERLENPYHFRRRSHIKQITWV